MKTKILLLFTVILFSVSTSNAQHRVSSASESETPTTTATSTEKTKASRGGFLISAGVNISNLSGSDASSKVGAAVSLGYTSKVDGIFIGTYTVDYTRGGYKVDLNGTNMNVNLDYIGLNMKFLFRTFGDLYIGTGFGWNFLVSGKYSYDGETMDVEDASIFDMPIPISARYYIGKNNSIYIDASYNFGLVSVFGDGFCGDGCNRGFMLSLGIKL